MAYLIAALIIGGLAALLILACCGVSGRGSDSERKRGIE